MPAFQPRCDGRCKTSSVQTRGYSFLSSRAKASRAAFRITKIIGPDSLRGDYSFDYQLADLAVLCQLNFFFAGVVQETSDLATIIGIDHPSEYVKTLLCGQTGSRRQPSVEAFGDSDR